MTSIRDKKWIFILSQMFLLFLSLIVYKNNVYAAPSLQQDSDGAYCINNAEDYETFVKDVDAGENYENCRIVLNNDIKVEGVDSRSTKIFYGMIDGNNHEIDFTANAIMFTRNVFPFNFRKGASVSNLKLCVHETLYSSKGRSATLTNLMHHVINCGEDSSLTNVEVYGDVVLVYDKSQMNITVSGISGGNNSKITNCRVNLNFEYDKDNSLSDSELISGLSQKSIEFRAFYNLGYDGQMEIVNCYSSSSYSQSIKELASVVANDIENTGANGVVVKFLWSNPSYGSASNVYYDAEKYPEIIDKASNDYQTNEIASNTLPNDASFGRTTADMKLQSTYSGFDFDDTWAISDKVNDGYPFIVAEDVKAVKKLIADLPAQITDADKDAVKAAKDAYDALTDDQKLQLSADIVQKLNDAVKALEKEDEPDQKDQEKKSETQKLKKGTKFTVGANKYQVTGDNTANFIGAKNKKVKKITVPASVTYKKQTFKVTAIGPKACKGYKKLATFTVGKNVTAIGAQAFANTPKLKKIKVQSLVLKKVGAKACKGMHKKGVIKVPKKMLKKYKKLFKGKGQKKTVKIK